MKQCSYCGTRVEDDAVQCSGCGAGSFSNICPNCGHVYETGGFCPVCGTKAGSKPKTCPRCGNAYFTNACPSCGYTAQQSGFASGAQSQAHVQPSYTQSSSPTQNTQDARAAKKIGCGRILLWIFFLPIMLIITVWKSGMKVIWKILLTLLIIGVFCSLVATDESTDTGTTGLNAPVITSTAKPAATATAKPEATAAPAATKTPATVIAPSIAGKTTENPVL